MATIKPIEGRSVHQIQSGQVIVDICSVAKELVENSIDAGATSIEVRFKNHGLDAVEVQDNGAGIAPEDFETIALKHHTSKLSTYDDLSALRTFGFRGEALSSLCALSKFHVITARASDGPKGTRLDFDMSGKLKGTSVIAAKQGTTVVVESLFYNLPVRRKELEKTIKREYNKVLALLNAYACISAGVRFSVSNQMPKGKKSIAFSTNSNPNTKENIANVYGTKTLLALIPLDLKFEMDPSNRPRPTQSARNWSTREDPGSREVSIVGHISRPVVGEGRQTPDRQMFFVNSRPCALPQVAKAFNEVYKSYNITQSPFIFADIKLDTNAYDVNVSPDKRTILLHDQTTLLENLKEALAELFGSHDQSVPQAQLMPQKVLGFKPSPMQRGGTDSTVRNSPVPANVPQKPRPAPEAEALTLSSASEEIPPQRGFIKASLIERSTGRGTEERALRPHARQQRKPISPDPPCISGPSSQDLEPLVEEPAPDPIEFELTPIIPSAHVELPRAVQDFNARIASQHAKHMARDRSPRVSGADDSDEGEQEENVPAVKQTPRKRLPQSNIQNAFDRMRPMRTPAQQATITIGDTTTVSTIGSQSRASRRSRIHIPKFSLSGTPLSQAPKKPLFMRNQGGLSVSGTQIEQSDDEDEDEDFQEAAGEDSSMPDAPVPNNPSLEKKKHHSTNMVVHEPNSDSLFVESSDQPIPPPPPLAEGLQEEDEAQPEPGGEDDRSDNEYINEAEKKAREEAKIMKMIAEAEESAARPTEHNLKRATKLFQGPRKQYMTTGFVRFVESSANDITRQALNLSALIGGERAEPITDVPSSTQLSTSNPEEQLSLTVTKSDFHSMRIIGQFNLGFILAVRPAAPTSPSPDLFIIDQHASDEKYNFERFASATVLVSQRLVHPHPLQLTAIEEEIILSNEEVLTANGFTVSVDNTGSTPLGGQRAKLLTLPMSKEVTFTPADLEELLALLAENPPSANISEQYIPRPSKVRKLLASRACRSSVMVGKTMTKSQMERVVRHMGDMDKPWSCPHGRPTMRHLLGLEKWVSWTEGGGVVGLDEVEERVDWSAYVRRRAGGGEVGV
ncbi:DNA mismatch repair protein MutL [Lindgomyces ingoldianus]|uniref:DNA mismatch repair protein MutL n=1 Tax=Lindgomyces ingoldianus TaxID=673940 RepID=A0ACB6QJU3_9PLEO|nr:DNA mismatch repair protein MutL [Lindgomyces ingoldianus]KAF2467294.1 DNA mismatch repair protein MutL [Lindgomyces ingoldianus]